MTTASPSGSALRALYVDYFRKAGHTHVPSSPLVPQGDPTLMFVNAGMVQFKHVFVGQEQRPYKRAVSVQKCMRVSGKHNDLEEVGRTARHHTLFEMLGNFSFGDYFKEEAISLAWNFVTRELGIAKDRLWVTTFAGDAATPADDEARALWRRIGGLPEQRVVPMGAADNFWSMGEVGPCGPCTEIHVDLGSGPATPADFANGRIVEIWNNVFMQYQRGADGALTPLAAPGVDTGMGLERVAAIAQGEVSNYHSDLFLPLLHAVSEAAGRAYGRSDSEQDVSMRVVADHARACAFLVADGVQPAADGRGYVLRRIMRRAIRHGQRLGLEQAFLADVAGQVVATMGAAYPELKHAQALIGKICDAEEEAFRRTLGGGLKVLSQALGQLLDGVKQGPQPELAGEVAFKLYDTYGFPKDLTDTIAAEHGVTVDEAGFAAAMQAQQSRSRGKLAGAGAADDGAVWHELLRAVGPSAFVGYPHEDVPLAERPGRWRAKDGELQAACRIVALVVDGTSVLRAAPPQAGAPGPGAVQVLLDPCPLYGESGGQVGDVGSLYLAAPGASQKQRLGRVVDTQKPLRELIAATVAPEAELRVGQEVWAGYHAGRRRALRAHHSATHLLHAALRKVLGPHVTQAGSLVEAERLRFDFAHFQALTQAEQRAVEVEVMAQVAAHHPVLTEELDVAAAREKGALALFGEKYGERVRVLSMGESIEFCGGTHARNTQEVGLFLIAREQAVQAGVRRLEAEVGPAAERRARLLAKRLAQVARLLGGQPAATALMQLATSAEDRPTGDPWAPTDEDAAGEATLAALARLLTAAAAAQEQVRAAQGPTLVHTPQALGLTTPSATALDFPTTLALRDTWQAIAQLVGGRTAPPAELLAQLGAADVAHLAAGVVNLQASLAEARRFLAEQDKKDLAGLGRRLAAAAKVLPNGVHLVCFGATPPGPVAAAANGPTGQATSGDAEASAAKVDLKALADDIRAPMGAHTPGVVALSHVQEDGRASLLLALTPALKGRAHAGKWVSMLAEHVGGRGGGRPDLAQAGGPHAAGIPAAFVALEALCRDL